VLILSFGLIILGTVLILLFESTRTLSDLPVGEKLICSLFHAVTPRTAGFNTLETRALAPATLFLTIILMFIGGSPGSTAGGIKTTTLSILLGIVKARIHDREEIELFKRRIPQDIAHRALAIVMLSICLVVISTMSLLLIEKNVDFLGILFEATSAFGTVGLSTGITPHLSFLGKITIILTMFIGRVGPLTLAFAIGRERPTIFYRYPEEKVVVG
jgi:trk system potassium uptake protein TrkH